MCKYRFFFFFITHLLLRVKCNSQMNNVLDLWGTRPCLAFANSNFYLENKTMRLITKSVIIVK